MQLQLQQALLTSLSSPDCRMQHWARRLEQEIDGVMRIFGGVQQLREVRLVHLLSCGDLLPSRNEKRVHNEGVRRR